MEFQVFTKHHPGLLFHLEGPMYEGRRDFEDVGRKEMGARLQGLVFEAGTEELYVVSDRTASAAEP